jgi:hypothetical protein
MAAEHGGDVHAAYAEMGSKVRHAVDIYATQQHA